MSGRNATRWAVFSIGFTSIGFQIILLRTILVQFHGMELTVMIALALWIAMTGLGAMGASWFENIKNRKILLQSLLSLLPILVLFSPLFAKLLCGELIPYGSSPGIQQVLYALVISEGPFCLLSGFLFVVISGQRDKKEAAITYAVESGGGAVAGFLVNIIMMWLIDLHTCTWIISLFSWILIMQSYTGTLKRKLSLSILIVVCFSVFYRFYSDLDDRLERRNFLGQRIIFRDSNPYGSVTITQTGSQLNGYENGNLLFSSGSVTTAEEDVHYAMAQRPHPGAILLISGGFPGILKEMQKYKPKEITFLELNPSLVYIAKQYAGFGLFKNLKIFNTDVRRFLRTGNKKFDVILVLVAPPSSLDLNLFYTDEFVGLVKHALNNDGVACWSLPSSGDYVSERYAGIASSLLSTMVVRFSHTVLVPGEKTYFLASDEDLELNITELPGFREIPTSYVNQYYLDIPGMKERSKHIMERLKSDAGYKNINMDLNPTTVWHHLSGKLTILGISLKILLIASIILITILIATLNPVSAGLFASGFALASIEVFLIFGLMVFFGNISFWIGIIVGLIMVGLAFGAWPAKRKHVRSKYRFLLIQVTIGIVTAIIPLLFSLLIYKEMYGVFVAMSLALFALFSAFPAGRLYQAGLSINQKRSLRAGADNYSADMFGAAAGIIAVSLFFIPLLGFQVTGILVLLISVLTSAIGYFRISS